MTADHEVPTRRAFDSGWFSGGDGVVDSERDRTSEPVSVAVITAGGSERRDAISTL